MNPCKSIRPPRRQPLRTREHPARLRPGGGAGGPTASNWTCTSPRTGSWWSSTTKRWTAPPTAAARWGSARWPSCKAFAPTTTCPVLPTPASPPCGKCLRWCAPTPLLVNIELKTGVLWYEGIEQKALDLVREMGMADRVIWSSFNHYSIETVRQLAPRGRDGLPVQRHHLRRGALRRRPRRAGAAPRAVECEDGRPAAALPGQRPGRAGVDRGRSRRPALAAGCGGPM